MVHKSLAFAALASLVVLSACGGKSDVPQPETAAPAASGPTGSASISGRVRFEGTPPAAKTLSVSADPKCTALHPNGIEYVPVHGTGGGLADAVVYVKTGVSGSYPVPAEAVLLDQSGCAYRPPILALQVGQTLRIRNSDDTLHNVHSHPRTNPEFNLGQPRQGMENNKTFDHPETMIPVGCDVHPWMRSYVNVFSHPFFALTKADGSFEIKGLPAGEYEVEVLHGSTQAVSAKVSVKDGEAARLDLTTSLQGP